MEFVFCLARLEFCIQQIDTSLSPTQLLIYCNQTSPLNTSFVSDFCLKRSGMSECRLFFIYEEGNGVMFLRSHKTTIDYPHIRWSYLWKNINGRSCQTLLLPYAGATHNSVPADICTCLWCRTEAESKGSAPPHDVLYSSGQWSTIY